MVSSNVYGVDDKIYTGSISDDAPFLKNESEQITGGFGIVTPFIMADSQTYSIDPKKSLNISYIDVFDDYDSSDPVINNNTMTLSISKALQKEIFAIDPGEGKRKMAALQ
jgi:hypothetical protein